MATEVLGIEAAAREDDGVVIRPCAALVGETAFDRDKSRK
jgi:hypothetical protein